MIAEWAERLSQPCSATNGLPTCPYARRALEDGKVLIIRGDVSTVIEQWSGRYDVALVLVEREAITPDAARETVDRLNLRHWKDDLCIMVDHPDDPFVVDGHSNSNGECVVFFVQRQSTLDRASAALKSRGYYDKWPLSEG